MSLWSIIDPAASYQLGDSGGSCFSCPTHEKEKISRVVVCVSVSGWSLYVPSQVRWRCWCERTQLHSLRPNQLLCELQSSYAAWLDSAAVRPDCWRWLRRQRGDGCEGRKKKGTALPFVGLCSTCKCTQTLLTWMMRNSAFALLRLIFFIHAWSMLTLWKSRVQHKHAKQHVCVCVRARPCVCACAFKCLILYPLFTFVWATKVGPASSLYSQWKPLSWDPPIQSFKAAAKALWPSLFSENNADSFHAFYHTKIWSFSLGKAREKDTLWGSALRPMLGEEEMKEGKKKKESHFRFMQGWI